MILNPNQRQKVRRLVGLAEELRLELRAFADRRRDKMESLDESRQALWKAQGVLKNVQHNAPFIVAERGEKEVAEATSRINDCAGIVQEFELEIAHIDARIDAIREDLAPTDKLAEALLKHTGIRDQDRPGAHLSGLQGYTLPAQFGEGA